jgi:hypothetical protein
MRKQLVILIAFVVCPAYPLLPLSLLPDTRHYTPPTYNGTLSASKGQ